MLLYTSRSRSRLRGGDIPWQYGFKADGTDPTLLLDLKNQRYAANNIPLAFTDLFTPTRATSKWVFNSSGDLTEVAAHQPAYDYNPVTGEARGFWIESQRMNVCRYSKNPFTNWSLSGATKTAAGTSFLGLFTDGAVVAVGATPATWHRLQSTALAWTSGTTYAWQVFVKAGVGNKIRVTLRDETAATESYINGTIGSALTVNSNAAGTLTYGGTIPCGGGYIINGTFAANSTTTNGTFGIGPYSTVAGDNIIVYGAQLEAGTYATSFIPTLSAAVTRSADVCVNSSSNTVPTTGWYNATGEGTFLVKWELPATPTASQRVAINVFRSSAQWDYRVFNETQGSGGVGYTVREAATTVAQIATATSAPIICSDAFAVKTNDFALYRNGASVGVDTVGNAPTGIDKFYLGSINVSGQFDGWIKEVLYYPKRISNSELVRITS